jgi:hypothetical protein
MIRDYLLSVFIYITSFCILAHALSIIMTTYLAPVFQGFLRAVKERNGGEGGSSASDITVGNESNDSIEVDIEEEVVDEIIKAEVAEAILSELMEGTESNDNLVLEREEDDDNDDDDDDDDYDDCDVEVEHFVSRVADSLKDNSLIGLDSLQVDIGGDKILSSSEKEDDRIICIEYCSSSSTVFKTKAKKLETILLKKGLNVEMNPYGPPEVKGSFAVFVEVGLAGAIPLIEMIGITKPFTVVKMLDEKKVAQDVLEAMDIQS